MYGIFAIHESFILGEDKYNSLNLEKEERIDGTFRNYFNRNWLKYGRGSCFYDQWHGV